MKIKLPSGLPFCGDLSKQTSPNPSLFEAQTPPEQPEPHERFSSEWCLDFTFMVP